MRSLYKFEQTGVVKALTHKALTHNTNLKGTSLHFPEGFVLGSGLLFAMQMLYVIFGIQFTTMRATFYTIKHKL